MGHLQFRRQYPLAGLNGRPAAATVHRRNGQLIATISDRALETEGHDHHGGSIPTADDCVRDLVERVRHRLGDWYTSFLYALLATALEAHGAAFERGWGALFLLCAATDAIAAWPGGVSRKQLRKTFGGRVSGKDLDDTLATLLKFELIREEARGQKRVFKLAAASPDPNCHLLDD